MPYALLVVLVLMGCAPIVREASFIPEGVEYFCGRAVPCPDHWQLLWDRAVVAAGREPTVPMDRIIWYVVPSPFPCDGGRRECFGQWYAVDQDHYIVLTRAALRKRDQIQHEMLHAILGVGTHNVTFLRAEQWLGITVAKP
jgi:hypothetical protein